MSKTWGLMDALWAASFVDGLSHKDLTPTQAYDRAELHMEVLVHELKRREVNARRGELRSVPKEPS